MNISVPIEGMEYIEATKISPLISHVKIKVCYVGQEPNRNGTVISKELAVKLGENLPGTPIVGYYDEETHDFDSHNREVSTKNGKYKLIDITKAYGFVPTDAKVWFQNFMDENIEHEYLCTEGYLWTEVYEESKGVLEHGNNQSMELNDKAVAGIGAKDNKSGKNIFIFSDGLIEKLCILGQNVEPCFEGAQITSFSINDEQFVELKNKMYSMINEVREIIKKEGGLENPMDENQNITIQDTIVDNGTLGIVNTDFAITPHSDKNTVSILYEDLYSKLKQEYSELNAKYDQLNQEYSEKSVAYDTLVEEVNSLREFKLQAEKKDKEEMINSFYMLSDDDKKDVIENIDKYSLDDIEAKLSIICVRNKVSFEKEANEAEYAISNFSLNLAGLDRVDSAPAWVQAVKSYN